jgi:hypothetical protein
MNKIFCLTISLLGNSNLDFQKIRLFLFFTLKNLVILAVLRIRIQDPDPGSGIRCFFLSLEPGSGSGIRDEKIQSQDPGPGLNIADLIFENLVSVFLVKNT